MRLASYCTQGQPRFGIVASDGVIDLTSRVQAADLKAALALGTAALEQFANAPVDWGFDDVIWQPPIVSATHIIGIGLNTRSHFEETAELMKRKVGDYPVHPRLFMRSPLSIVGHKVPLCVPKVSKQLDYEGEIVIIMGRQGRYIPRDKAMQYVGGYACSNDGSVRDFQLHSNQVTAGKNFACSGAIGPWLLTADEVSDPSRLTLETRVNGHIRQRLEMSDLIFGFAELISYISQIYHLQVGDIIFTGSPAGIGALKGQWLKSGDLVEIEIPGVGILANPVESEA